MGLRIKTNIASLKAQRAFGQTSQRTSKSQERLASGFRINRAADDAAGLAISSNLTAKIRSTDQARRNAGDSVSMIQIAEGSMEEVSNILIRLRELAVQASSDTIGNSERSFVNREYVQLVDEIDRISNTTEFNGLKLLQGSEANNGLEVLDFHIGPGDGAVDNTDRIQLNIEELKINTAEVFGLGKEGEVGPMNVGDEFERSTAAGQITVLDAAMHRVADARAMLGSKQNRLGSAMANLAVANENNNSSRSRIRDVDFAAETAALTQHKILGQAGVSVLSQANSWPDIALNLLR